MRTDDSTPNISPGNGVNLYWDAGEIVGAALREFPPSFQVRSIDGRWNNSAHRAWGRSNTNLLRQSTVSYADRTSAAPTSLPGARSISNIASVQHESLPNGAERTSMLWQWGQFLDHDISFTPEGESAESLAIAVPRGDSIFDPFQTGRATLRFVRSEFDPRTGTGPNNPREQVNKITAYIDASNVYGSEGRRARALRTNDGTGKLRTSGQGRLLPYNEQGLENDGGDERRDLFLAGDVRVNEQVGLAAMQTLFVREHNRLADDIAYENPGLSGDEIYEVARKIVGAQMQVITFNEFLSLLLGPQAIGPYSGYNSGVDPTIGNEFSTAAFRFGHTMLPPNLLRIDTLGNKDEVLFREAFFNPSLLVDKGISEFLRGLVGQQAEEIDLLIVDEVRNLLFGEPGGLGQDLAALNIQRGRDHGIADYNTVRRAYGLPAALTFSDVSSDPRVQDALSQAYSDVGNLDLWTGGLAEDHAPGAMIGETFHAIITDQFQRLRDGDRFWFENDPWFLANPSFLDELRATTLADVIRRNTRIEAEISDSVFTGSDSCVTLLGITSGTINRSGVWSSDCDSANRTFRQARVYTFTLDQQADVQIDLVSATDTYLYLLQGTGTDGQAITDDDDGGSDRNSRIARFLPAGTYTIEATTYDSHATGSFTLILYTGGQ